MKYKIWNKTDNLYTPAGTMFTPNEIKEQYPLSFVSGVKYIICDAPINMGVFMEFTQTRDMYKNMGADIASNMSDQQVLDAITEFENRPQEIGPSVEERTAAALEFLALNSLPDEEV
jgi:hypothetical protein